MPGGVQFHVRDLAEALIARGHTVSVLAPADDDTPIPEYMTPPAGRSRCRYNGAVARMTFGPVTAARVRKWLAAGEFDVLHLHEPVTPSLGMLALWIADGPIVATFHTALHPVAAAADGVPARAASRWRRSPPGSRCPRTRAARSSSTWAGTPS